MDTSRVDGVKAPLHDGTPRSHQHIREHHVLEAILRAAVARLLVRPEPGVELVVGFREVRVPHVHAAALFAYDPHDSWIRDGRIQIERSRIDPLHPSGISRSRTQ